jgi:hypothetical protein
MKKKRAIITISIVLGLPLLLFASISYFAGAGRKTGDPLPKGNIEIPVKRTIQYKKTSQIQ